MDTGGPSSPRKGMFVPLSLASLEGLPDDVLAHVFDELDDVALVRLRRVSRALDMRVRALGIPLYLTNHPVGHATLHPTSSSWPSTHLFEYNGRIERSLNAHSLHAVQIGPAWARKCIPALSVSETRVVLGVGTQLVVHALVEPQGGGYAPRVLTPGREYPIAPREAGSGADVVGVHELPGGALALAQFDGTVQRVELGARARSTAHYIHPRGTSIHSLAGAGQLVLTVAQDAARVFRANSPWVPPVVVALPDRARAWSALVDDGGGGPARVFLGHSGGIHNYAIREGGATHLRTLHGLQPEHSAAYDLILPPDRTAHGPGRETLLSAWHDGVARLHDLRDPSPAPRVELDDPWADAGFYSAAFVGEWGVAAGGAQHGIVSVWDVRMPRRGWSVFSPGGRGSPVYALAGEGGRLWGVSDRRAFVLAFDGAGDNPAGIMQPAARAPPPRKDAKDVVNGWRRRGGKFNWTVHYGEHARKESTTGYCHNDGGMTLFDSKIPVY